jgi:apolipoprotein N-acyltransferase
VQRLAQRLILSWGWQRRLTALGAGAVTALAMPPLDIVPGMIIGLMLLVWLIDSVEPGGNRFALRSLWSAFGVGWWFGYGYFLAGLWWLGAAFVVDSDEFLWAMPLGVIGLPAALAVFHGFGVVVARLFWGPSIRRVLALGFGLGGAELLRGMLFTGFPWNSLGQVFDVSLPSLQAASVIGLEGLTLLAIVIGASFAALGTGRTAVRRFAPPLLSLALVAAIIAYGFDRLRQAPDPASPDALVPGVALRILQPNIPQREKNRPGSGEAILKGYLELSDKATSPTAPGLTAVSHLIWPESPFPFILSEEQAALAMIGEALPPNTTLITGAVRLDRSGNGNTFYNALQVVGADGAILDSYDKLHLVPFGEYLPAFADEFLRAIGLRQFVTTPGGFAPGGVERVLGIAGLPPALPLICYEAIFPKRFNRNLPQPEVTLNITNDAWFGVTPGPHQHFRQARLRTVENGLPLIRAANSGISAIVDPYGRVIAQLSIGERGVLDGGLPKVASVTLRQTLGSLPIWALLIVFFLGGIQFSRR